MGIRNAERFQHALDAAVFAPDAVQGVEGDVRLKLGQDGSQVAAGIDLGNAIAGGAQCLGALPARHQGNLALRRESAHENGDMAFGRIAGHRSLGRGASDLDGSSWFTSGLPEARCGDLSSRP